MVFMYHISPLPPIIGMCIKDVHCPSTALGSSRSLSWINLSCVTLSSVLAVLLLRPWLTTRIILKCSCFTLLSRISAVSLSVGISYQ